jgi:hypothetical protein
VVEATVTIIAATIPVLRVLVIEISGSSAERSRSRALEVIADPSKPGRVGEHATGSNNADVEAVYELDGDVHLPDSGRRR